MSNPKYVRKFTALFTAILMVFAYVPRGWGAETDLLEGFSEAAGQKLIDAKDIEMKKIETARETLNEHLSRNIQAAKATLDASQDEKEKAELTNLIKKYQFTGAPIVQCIPQPAREAINKCFSDYKAGLVLSHGYLKTIKGLNDDIKTKKENSSMPFAGAVMSSDASLKFGIVRNALIGAKAKCEAAMSVGDRSYCHSSCKHEAISDLENSIDPKSSMAEAAHSYASEYRLFMTTAEDTCAKIYNDSSVPSNLAITNKFTESMNVATKISGSATETADSLATTVMTGMGIAAVAMIVQDRKESRDNEAKANQAASNAANAVIQTAAGQVDCRAANGSGITNPDCKAPLMSYCSNPQKARDAGCVAFDKSICASGGSASYCVGKQADEYCDRSNAGLADSPSCMWMKDRPSSCRSQPDDIKCMSNISQADLKSKCEKFNNDPLCRASASGQMVLQPNSGSGVPNLSTPVGSNNPSRTPSSDLNLSQSTSEAHRWMCQQGLVADCTLPQ